jgi:hypothetical protein
MSQHDRMSPLELRASIGLASIFGLRLLGMFVILPVLRFMQSACPGATISRSSVSRSVPTVLPRRCCKFLSAGGRPVRPQTGDLSRPRDFRGGQFVAAAAGDIYIVILGRVLQGAGAISAAVMAMAADLTRDEHRTKAMAMIGSTIGLSFALSLIASPWLNDRIGVPGLFALTGFLAMAAVLVVWRVVPDVVEIRAPRAGALREFWAVLGDAQLARLNYGIFALHAVLMALFIVVPFALRDAGLPLSQHWKVYLPVMLASFVLMLPPIMAQGRARPLKLYFSGSVALVLAAHIRACPGSTAAC